MPSVTKDTGFTVYRVRGGHGDHEWATIAVRSWRAAATAMSGGEPRECGEIMIYSSFGSWANQWGHLGEPFQKFLTDVEFDYLFGKLMGSKLEVFDGEASVKRIVERLLEERRENGIDQQQAREIYDNIQDNANELEMSADAFVRGIGEIYHEFLVGYKPGMAALDRGARRMADVLSEPWERIASRDDHQAVGFWRDIWPVFIEHIKTEIREAQSA